MNRHLLNQKVGDVLARYRAQKHKSNPILDSTQRVENNLIPPGLDTKLYGTRGYVTFKGHFYAQPHIPYQTFSRYVQIVMATKEILVAYDLELKTIYVIDREKNLSLGCKMWAKYNVLPQSINPIVAEAGCAVG